MEVTAALLADAATVQSGKLYIHGGGWDVIQSGTFPSVHPSLSLAFNVRIEYSEALDDIPLAIELLDEDDALVGPKIEGTVNVGHAPRSTRGQASFVPQALTFNLVRFEKAGGYRFRITSGERELASVPFRLAQT